MIEKIVTDNRLSYDVLSLINEGSQGLIYKVTRRDKVYVAKVFKSISDRLWNNITLMASQGAPNLSENASFIWPIHTFSHPHRGYIMEYVDTYEFKSVHQLVDIEGLSIVERLKISVNLMKAIAALHSQKGLFFGDISSANVLIHPEYFSIVIVDTDGITNQISDVVGTPGYMNKETILSQKPSFESDIFATYVMIHEAIFNLHPFYGTYARKYPVYDEGLNQAILNDAGYVFVSQQNSLTEEGRPYAIWSYFITPSLQKLFTKIFSEYPPLEETILILEKEIDNARKCDCGEFTMTNLCSVCFREVN